MKDRIAIITGSGGVVGMASSLHWLERGFDVIGIDNDMRGYLFGQAASTTPNVDLLQQNYHQRYYHEHADIRDVNRIQQIFHAVKGRVAAVIHTAGQPSHDWSAKDPVTDFEVNVRGTINLLEAARQWCPEAPFVFCSTNKVYGDFPNKFDYEQLPRRWDFRATDLWYRGFNESVPIDGSMHSPFGAGKAAADLYVQEYGRYFGLYTVCFRCGCITGRAHRGAKLHGFLSYLTHCIVHELQYTIIGYQGRQVRDNLHASDLARAIWQFCAAPEPGRVYNIGGGRYSNCSILEAIDLIEQASGESPILSYQKDPRKGDHKWWISDTSRFESDYGWYPLCSLTSIIAELVDAELEEKFRV